MFYLPACGRASLLLCLCLGALAAPLPVLHVVGDAAPPFRIVAQGNWTGIYCDVMREIARRSGYALRFSEVPPKRALLMLEQGQADLMLGPNRSPERERYMVFLAASFPPARKAFYQRPGSAPIRGYADLAGLSISVELGKRFFEPFDSDPELHLDRVIDSLTALRKVAAAHSDVALMPEQEGDWLIRQHGLLLHKADWLVDGRSAHIALSRRSAHLAAAPALEAAFAAMRQDGSLEAIYQRYR